MKVLAVTTPREVRALEESGRRLPRPSRKEEVMASRTKTLPLEEQEESLYTLTIGAESPKEAKMLRDALGLSRPAQPLPSTPTLTVIDRAINRRKTGLSESALATYKTDWRVFAKKHSTLPQEPQPVRDYIYGYTNPRTRAKIYSELCSLYECAEQLGGVNVMPHVEPPPRIEALPVHHTEAETRGILAEPRTPKETALVQLIEVCGLRIGEASSMNVGDVGSESISFRGKAFRGKTEQRELYLPQQWIAPLAPLCPGRGAKEPLFAGQRGRLTASGLRRIYEAVCQRAGIPEGRRHPHCGRHSAGTHLIEAGCDQFTVQQLLGHKRLDMTSHYVHLAQGKKAREKLERYSITAAGERTPDTLPSEATKGGYKFIPTLYLESLTEAELLPELLDRMIALGEMAHELRHALGGNGHKAEKLAEIEEYLKQR